MPRSWRQAIITEVGTAARIVLAIGCFAFSRTALSNEILRPKDFTELQGGISAEDAHRVEGAKIAWADYDAIRRDFPTIAKLSERQLDEWLITNFAFIGSEQPRLNEIRNTPIPLASESKPAFRPSGWNRSAILEAYDPKGATIGMVDVKGFGHGARTRDEVESQFSAYQNLVQSNDGPGIDALRTSDHSDGLMSFGEAVAETSRQKAAQLLFEESKTGLETVESYAVIRLPIDIRKDHGKTISAALYLRQAHFGRENSLPVPPNIYQDNHGGRQMTASGSAVDFGGVMIQDSRLVGNFGPLPGNENAADPQSSRAWAWGHDAAQAFDRGDSFAVTRHLGEMLGPLGVEASRTRKRPRGFARTQERMRRIADLRRKGVPISEIIKAAQSERFSYELIKAGLAHPEYVSRALALRSLRGRNDADSLALIQKGLTDPDFIGRMDAVNALAGRTDPGSLVLLGKMLQNPDVALRAAAVRVLKDRGETESLALIEKALQDREPAVRRTALEILQGKPGSRPLRLIEIALKDPDRDVRSNAIQFLQGRSDAKSLKLIEKVLEAGAPYVRLEAIKTLHGRKDSGVLRVIERLFSDPDYHVRANLLAALQERKDAKALKLIEKALKHPDSAIRSGALSALQGRDDPESLRLIGIGMSDTDPNIQKKALEALRGRSDPISLSMIEKALHDKSIYVRASAMLGLQGRTDPGSLPLIEELLQDPKPEFRAKGASALEGRSDPQSLSLIKKALSNSDASVRHIAIKSLWGNTNPEVILLAGNALKDSSFFVRQSAKDVLVSAFEKDPSLWNLAELIPKDLDPYLLFKRLKYERLSRNNRTCNSIIRTLLE